jgi:hypothetical protein
MSNFTFDGDTATIGGYEYTIRVESDPYMSLLDEQGEGVWCGRIEWADNHPYSGYPCKPNDFVNGRTMKLTTDRSSTLWWEVPADVKPEYVAEFRRSLLDILEYGYSIVMVESSDGFSSGPIGGIEFGADLDDVASDLIAEIEYQRAEAQRAYVTQNLDYIIGACLH